MYISPSFFSPDIEKRLSSWVKCQERKKTEDERAKKRFSITISREYGCEAYDLAEMLAKRLKEKTNREWIIFDKELLEKVAQKENLAETCLKCLGDTSHYLDMIISFLPNFKTHNERYQMLAEEIMRIAEDGDSIIIGRGSSILTSKFKNCYSFRLEAPFDFRIKSISRRGAITEEEAVNVVNENQSIRDIFLEDFLGAKIDHSNFYDMIFNNKRVNIKDIADIIMTYIIKKSSL